ncbi:Serine/threonine-protein kinase tel1 [Rhodotorula kratochvilovae]
MSAVREFEGILAKLESDKIKERTEGVSRCRDFLASKRNFNAVNRSHSWLSTLQLLFSIVIKERNAAQQKHSAATDKRLDEAAQLVRTVVEKVHRVVTRKTAKAIVAHLTQMTAVQGKLQPYALTYMKALRTVLAYPPHVEHLDERQWTDVVMLCFSAVLGDKIKIGQDFVDEAAMDIDEDERLGGALRAGLDEEMAHPSTTRRTANPTEIELVGVIEVAFRSKSSPFLTYAQAIFRKFLRFFRLFPAETTAHLSALTALNRAFADVDLNDQRSMRRIGPHLWKHILALWATKSPSLKEQVVMSLRYLFPFVVPPPLRAGGASSSSAGGLAGDLAAIARAKALFDAVLSEPIIRWREAYVLDLDALALGLPPREEHDARAYHARTFRLGEGFDDKHAVAWGVVELGADALARIYEVEDAASEDREVAALLTPTQRGKRRKVEDPLSVLLDSLSDPALTSQAVAFRLQILLFLVDRHWAALDPEACHRIFAALVQLLPHSDPQVERWAFVAVAAVAHAGLPLEQASTEFSPSRRKREKTASSPWDPLWLLVQRKLATPEVCRPAAHAANVLLAHDRVGPATLADSIEAFARDVDVQGGANFPSDAVCLFLEWVLAIAASDARLVRLHLADKVLNWVTGAWSALDGVARAHAFGQARPHADPLSLGGLVALVARLSGIAAVPRIEGKCVVPDCAIASMALELSETARMRDYLEARVPPYKRDDAQREDAPWRTPASYDATGGAPEDLEHSTPRKISGWLLRMLKGLTDGVGDATWTSMPVDQARRCLDLAALALVVEGVYALHRIPTPKPAIRAARNVLTALAPTLTLKKWQPAERALLVGALSPIIVAIPQRPAIEYPVLLDPGIASGVPRHLLPVRTRDAATLDLNSPEMDLLRAIWKNDDTRQALDEVLAALRFLLSDTVEASPPPSTAGTGEATPASFAMTQAPSTQASQRIRELEQTQRADDFGESRASSVGGSGGRASQPGGTGGGGGAAGEGRAGAAIVRMCIKGFISAEMAASGSARPVRLQEVVDALVASDGEDSIVIAEEAFAAAHAGLATFGLAQAEAVLQHLGETLLPDYRYARDERFARIVLRFLECTTQHWVIADDESKDDFARDARTLCSWFVNGLRKKIFAAWRVRLQFTAFLDRYLVLDRSMQYWDLEGRAPRSEDGRVIAPTAVIPFMLADADFRVRFRATTSTANLFNLYAEAGMPEESLFQDIKENTTSNVAESERMLTQILCNANLVIVASTRRRAPYQLLVRTSGESPELAPIVIATLEGVAARLGFDSLADLYLVYARYLTWSEVRMSGNQPGTDLVHKLPYRACGFPTLRDARKADFVYTASWLLQYDKGPVFATLCDVLKRAPQQGRLDCFGETAALMSVRFHVENESAGLPVPPGELQRLIGELAAGAGAGDAHEQEQLIATSVDDMLAETIAVTYTAFWSAEGEVTALKHDKRAAETFRSILSLPNNDLYFRSEPPPPHWSPEQTVAAAVWLDQDRRVFSNSAVVFSVVHNLLGRIHRAIFIDEQRRQLVNLALVLALCHRAAREPTILAALTDGLISLLPRVDVADLVSSMLRWAVQALAKVVGSSQAGAPFQTAFCEQLVRIALALVPLGPLVAETEAAAAVTALRNEIDAALRQLAKAGVPTLAEAALLWPYRLFDPNALEFKDAYAAVASSFAPVSKFGLIAPLRQHGAYSDFLSQPECSRLAWQFMEAISPGAELDPKDCLAFAEFLHDAKGDVQAPSVDEPGINRAETNDTANPPDDQGIKKLVAAHVLGRLGDADRALVQAAFDSARLVFSSPGNITALFAQDGSQTSLLASFFAHPSLQRPRRLRKRADRTLALLGGPDWIARGRSFDGWVKALAELLAEHRAESDEFFAQVVPLIRSSAAFAKEVFPHLVHSILLQGATSGDSQSDEHLSRYFQRLLEVPTTHTDVVRLLVDTAIHLRKYGRPDLHPSSRSRFDTWLSVPWILLAKGAVKTHAYLAALLFLELAHEYNGLFTLGSSGSPYDRRLDESGQALLYEIYARIDEPDGFYGRESPDARQALLRRYRHEGQWEDAFRMYGARHEAQSHSFGASDPTAMSGVVSSLSAFGFNRLALSVFQPARLDGTIGEHDVPPELPYELAWRTDVWDLPIERSAAETSSVSLYKALRASRMARSSEGARSAATDALVTEVKKLGSVSLDVPRPNGETLATVLALRDIHRLAYLQDGDKVAADLKKDLAVVPDKFSFAHAERVLSTRISLLRGIRAKERVEQVGDDFASDLYKAATATERACLLELSRVGRNTGHLQASYNAVTLAHSLVEDGNAVDVDRELADVLWAQGEHTTAISLLGTVHKRSPAKSAAIFAKLGEWTAEARLRNPLEILTECFDPAIRALERDAPAAERARVYHSFASFADAQFEDLSRLAAERRKRSEAYEKRKGFEFTAMSRQLQSGSLGSEPMKTSRRQAEQHIADDRRQVEEAEATARNMLWRSLENYARAFSTADEFDDKVYRFCALWLGCADDDDLHTKLKPLLTDVPSFKFVFLAYQLSARLTKAAVSVPSASNVRKLVLRLCQEHPFHTLYPVQALRDPTATKSSRRSSASRESSVGLTSNNSRAQAASDIVEKTKRIDSLRPRAEAVEIACEAYAEWASFSLKGHSAYIDSRGTVRKGALPILRSMRILTKVRDLPIPVTTSNLPVAPTGKYDDFPTLQRYEEYFDTAGGIHVPKIVVCLDSTGQRYKQLLKGDDDIRQDAVMEQAFELVNTLLARDEGGRRRKLKIRTYKVVPLQNSNGLIEFVANTAPLGNFLQGLYDQMAPGVPKRARDQLRAIENKHKSRPENRDADKDEAFRKILADTPPLLRYLFWQKHKVPSLWFDMRLNYSRSVATTSIIGHVVGLGDRHVSNILMDEARGELVHIDLGIAFDQGKRLPIPELVPFRLTQNLIDGFGMSGVDGVFRRCCEETLRVLRERSSVIMTILEVFKHDPLQNWAVSAEMAKRIQGSSENDAHALDELPDDADRALSIVRSKLDDRLSVQYTVNQLIQEATNPSNLARIFSGWQPYY